MEQGIRETAAKTAESTVSNSIWGVCERFGKSPAFSLLQCIC